MRALTPLALLAACLPGCSCDAVLDAGRSRVTVTDDVIIITHDDRTVAVIDASDIAVLDADAAFIMEFGMFDIQEDVVEIGRGQTIRVDTATDSVIAFTVSDGVGPIATGTINGGSVADEVRVTVNALDGNGAIIGMPCEPNHHFIGLGAQTHDVDHRGQRVPLWVSEQGVGKSDSNELPLVWQLLGRRHTTHVPMPAMLRSDGTGFVLDVVSFSRFDICASNEFRVDFEAWQPEVTLRVLPGDSVHGGQVRLREALGRPRLLPPYVFAPWNDAIFSEQQVRDFARFLRENELPSSVIWSEDWRGGKDAGALYRLDEDWRLDREQYPTYEDMTATFKRDGFVHQVYFNTFVTQGGDVFDEITAARHDIRRASDGTTFLFTGVDKDFQPTTLLDLNNAAARDYAKGHLRTALDLGARGWMADFAEWLPVEDVVLGDGADPRLAHNPYAVEWARINREAVAEAGLLDEVVLFSRSGFLGSPEVVDVMWAGDQRTSFQDDDGLPTIIPLGVGLAVTGFTYYAHDIAGYQSSTNAPVSEELFFRWTTLGAFSPVMRTHHGTHARQNHMLQSNESSTAHWKRYAEIHIRLYPYLRALAVADATGSDDVASGLGRMPLWIPLPVLFPDDEAMWSIKDQVLLGPSLLVAPVQTEGAVTRDVVLPVGRRFVAFPMPGAPEGSVGRSRDSFSGRGTVAAELSEIPVFMPAGGIVPMTAEPALTLLEVESGPLAERDLSSTTGDREVVVALGESGFFIEEDGALYALTMTGTGPGLSPPAGADADGAVTVTGDATINGDGYLFALTGQPASRTTRVVFR